MISASTCCGRRGGGDGFPESAILHQKTESLFLALKLLAKALPCPGRMWPQESP